MSIRSTGPYKMLRHVLLHVRRQPKQIQHLYASVVAGTATLLLGIGILYFDYGFWRDKTPQIPKQTQGNVEDAPVEITSPGEMLSNFFNDAQEKWGTLKAQSKSLLESTETYSKDEALESQ